MNDQLIAVASALLVGVGVLAALNLLRVWWEDWREDRRQPQAGSRSRRLHALRTPPGTAAPTHRRCPKFLAVTVALAPSPSLADAPAPACLDARTTSVPAGLCQPHDADLALSMHSVPEPDPQSKQLVISTDRPGFSDSSSIAPVLHLQVETGFTYMLRDHEGVETRSQNFPEILLRTGLLDDRLELRVATSGYVWSRSDDGSASQSVEGFSDVSVGFKLKLIDQDNAVPRLCVEAMTTLGGGSDALSNQDLEPTLKLIGSWDLGMGFTLTTNGVLTYATTAGERFVQGAGSVVVFYSVTDQLSVFAETYVVAPYSKGADAAYYVDFGGAYLLNKRIQIDARVGFGLNQQADNFLAGVGISFLF